MIDGDASVDRDYLELSDNDVSGRWSPETYETETTPVDPLGTARKRDIRDVPERGN
jgi:hypothetical protein